MELDMDSLYQDFQDRQMERDPVGRSRLKSRKLKKDSEGADYDEWTGVDDDVKPADSGSDDSDKDVLMTDSESESEAVPLTGRAKTFFDNPVFSDLPAKTVKKKGIFDKEMEDVSSDEDDHVMGTGSDDEDEIRLLNTRGQIKKKKNAAAEFKPLKKGKKGEDDGNKVEVVPVAIGSRDQELADGMCFG
jgi:hypothetical protein